MIEPQPATLPLIEDQGIRYLQFERLGAFPEVIHGVFTRLGGHSQAPFKSLNVSASRGDRPEDVLHNRLLVLKTLGLEDTPCATLWQVHGAGVAIFDPQAWEDWGYDWNYRSYQVDDHELIWTSRPRRQADAIVTNQSGVTLTMSFADCVPLLFYDPRQQVIALAHAGWRGTAQGIALTTVEAMHTHFGSQPAEIRAGIAPAIGACCYEVSSHVRDLFEGRAEFSERPTSGQLREKVSESAVFSTVTLAGTADQSPHRSLRLDLWETNRNQLRLAGLAPEHIECAEICTNCQRELFFSHRGEQGQTGRFPVVMALQNTATSVSERARP